MAQARASVVKSLKHIISAGLAKEISVHIATESRPDDQRPLLMIGIKDGFIKLEPGDIERYERFMTRAIRLKDSPEVNVTLWKEAFEGVDAENDCALTGVTTSKLWRLSWYRSELS